MHRRAGIILFLLMTIVFCACKRGSPMRAMFEPRFSASETPFSPYDLDDPALGPASYYPTDADPTDAGTSIEEACVFPCAASDSVCAERCSGVKAANAPAFSPSVP